MRITSKGPVTIPQEIRDKAGLLPGTELGPRLRMANFACPRVEMEPVAGGLLSACAEGLHSYDDR